MVRLAVSRTHSRAIDADFTRRAGVIRWSDQRRICGQPPVLVCIYCAYMARVNVYLPDDLAEAVRRAELNVSRITQDAVRRALASADTNRWLERVSALEQTVVTHASGLEALASARDELGG